ncbi:hypothetical protein N7530_008439 [Penicillium desertorum]|uniref:Uncharacterized protein n=1 Tax=Penicillium desertorum TaxID=1303715 RepID=A0A9X0BLA7_9EURO|nr:hypothetical protein N7530_008439 [Penicillium desertorum]
MEITRNAFGKSEQNEEFTRITLNLLFASHHCATSHPDNASPDLKVTDLHLNAEGLVNHGLVTYKGAMYDLIGYSDYSLWYGIEKDVALGGVLVEDKSGATATTGLSQTLGMREPKPKGPVSGSDHKVLEPTSHQDIPTPVMEYITQVSTKLPHVNPADMSIDDT